MLTLLLDITNHLGITFRGVVLQILEGKGCRNRYPNALIGHEDNISDHSLEMTSSSDNGIGRLIESIYTYLDLANIGC